MREARWRLGRSPGQNPDPGALKRRYLQQVEVFQDLTEAQIFEVERNTRMSTVGPGESFTSRTKSRRRYSS